MRQTVLVVGAEYREALETAVWYLKRGDAVYVGVTNGEAWLAEKLEKEYPGYTCIATLERSYTE